MKTEEGKKKLKRRISPGLEGRKTKRTRVRKGGMRKKEGKGPAAGKENRNRNICSSLKRKRRLASRGEKEKSKR